MARIRTIKPDFWTDEALTECSMSARLLFIGLLNFADDNGNLEASAKKIKMQVFPADAIDCAPLLDELIAHGLLIEYSVSDKKYLHIKGFRKHQVINRPSKSSIPQPSLNDDSLSDVGGLTDGREEERKGKEEEQGAPPDGEAPPTAKADPIPYRAIADAYNAAMVNLPKVRDVTPARKTAIRSAWQESQDRRTLEFWKAYFEECADDAFLNGTGPYSEPHQNWRPDFDHLLKKKTIVKVYERAMDRLERSA